MSVLPRRFNRIKKVLDSRMQNLSVLVEDVNKPHNLSAILRTCDAAGVFEANFISNKQNVKTYNSTAQGSQKWLKLKNHQDSKLQNLLTKIDFASTKKIGSVGCKVASILRGESDVYISLSGKTAPKDWDIAAPEAILKAAGGAITNLDIESLTYNKKNYNPNSANILSETKQAYNEQLFDQFKQFLEFQKRMQEK